MYTLTAITGPTASGKTACAIEIARARGAEIVSFDSRQFYRGMDIGTAKPTQAEMRGVPHHMLDVADPEEDFSVARYVDMAAKCVDDILSRGKLPILAGGTGLYIDSLISGRDFAANDGDEKLREELLAEYDRVGGEEMLRRLREFDPERAAKLPAGDKRRIVRAIEIYKLTGMTITKHDARTRAMPPRYDAAQIILGYADRAALYARIDRRVDEMVAEGLFEEVQGLLDSGLSEQCTAMQAIGYKEPAMALRGEISRGEAVELIKLGSRRYAKRQMTWFRANPAVQWLDASAGADEIFRAALQKAADFDSGI